MKIIKPSFRIMQIPYNLGVVEEAARICYRSEDMSSRERRDAFLKKLLAMEHMTPFEHLVVTVHMTTDRTVTHELVRHRLASFNQESQRYVNYRKSQIEFINPMWVSMDHDQEKADLWTRSCLESELAYLKLLEYGTSPQEARLVLNQSVATNIIVTANLREWHHIFNLRAIGTTGTPYPEMQRLMIPIYEAFSEQMPAIFPYINFSAIAPKIKRNLYASNRDLERVDGHD